MRKRKLFIYSALAALSLAAMGVFLRAFPLGAAADTPGPSSVPAADGATAQTPSTGSAENQHPQPSSPAADGDASSPAGADASSPSDTPTRGGGMILVRNPRYNHDKPLLFDSGEESDNSSCMVCHIDFEEEPISRVHLKAGITCMACHGDSMTHRGDEFNITRPDVIWGRAEIEPFCRQCHLQHKHPDKVEAYRKEHLSERRANGRYVSLDSPCTDCHGKHAITVGEGNFK
ncbi:MAG: hypothetical protein Kow0040_17470 [Thermogutta sp.]